MSLLTRGRHRVTVYPAVDAVDGDGNACQAAVYAARKAGLGDVFNKVFAVTVYTGTTNCEKRFNPPAAELARSIVEACSKARPADVRRSCYETRSEAAGRSLSGAIEQVVRAAADKK